MRRKPVIGVVVGALVVGASHVTGQEARDTTARAVLWSDPGDVATRDLFWGPGSADRAPQPPFAFVEEDTGGTKPKVVVRDAAGTTWNVKFAGPTPANNEVHAEIAASRIAWAFGYPAEEHYYVAEGVIDGVKGLRRAAGAVDANGRFTIARFERQDSSMKRTGRHWSLTSNPFKDTQELSGLMLVLALVNNWDTKTSNLSVFQRSTGDGTIEEVYLVSDFGSSFGKMGPMALLASRNRWSLEDYRKEPFVEGVDDESLNINHKGDVTIHEVPIEHARWFAGLAAQLRADQVRRAFEAAGASPEEVSGFTDRLIAKLNELQHAVTAKHR
jgi:hypothetical protein